MTTRDPLSLYQIEPHGGPSRSGFKIVCREALPETFDELPAHVRALDPAAVFVFESGNGMTAEGLPHYLTRFENLEKLSVPYVGLKKIPPWLAALRFLRKLHVGYNALVCVPDSIGECSSLETIILSGNPNIGPLPESLGTMPNLVALGLDGTGLTEVPAFLSKLRNLEILTVRENHLVERPYWVGALEHVYFFVHDPTVPALFPQENDREDDGEHVVQLRHVKRWYPEWFARQVSRGLRQLCIDTIVCRPLMFLARLPRHVLTTEPGGRM